jgi:hypothetical protein
LWNLDQNSGAALFSDSGLSGFIANSSREIYADFAIDLAVVIATLGFLHAMPIAERIRESFPWPRSIGQIRKQKVNP